jgi:anti-sigma regulatory factor (Ser/Thr protein kinase)/serine/threonine protein phosphatase PrpC
MKERDPAIESVREEKIRIVHTSDVFAARRAAAVMAEEIGFDEKTKEETILAVSELASNLAKHTEQGTLILTILKDETRDGMQIESVDRGPGIADVEEAMRDGYSTVGSLGYGLGTANRLTDEFDIKSRRGTGGGTRIVARRWKRIEAIGTEPCPLEFGAATRAHPKMGVNGDAFVIKTWGESALVALIDGLGHGQFAHRAAQAARRYIEGHFNVPMDEIFRNTGRACRATRGIVMALARFDWGKEKLTHASIGNIETHVFGSSKPMNFTVRRGIIGGSAPRPVVTEHDWIPHNIMVLHTDGVRSHWRLEDFPDLFKMSAAAAAQHLLHALAKENDDATIIVVKGKSVDKSKFKL